MTPEDDDRALSQAFAELRREEEGRTPAFAEVVRRGRARHAPAAGFLPVRPLRLAAAVALVALGVWLGVRGWEPRPAAVPSLAEWRSPTDFLLATPGRDLLAAPAGWGRSVLDLWDMPSHLSSGKEIPVMTLKRVTLKARTIIFLLLGAWGCALAARAETPGDDPISRAVFPPDLVMKHSQEINLDDRQRAAIKEQAQKAQAQAMDAQFDLQAESQKLVRLLQARPVDETAALAQVDKVLALERQVKRAQILLLVRIKNLLTEAQQARLTELRLKE